MFENDLSFDDEDHVNFSANYNYTESSSAYPQLVYRSISIPTLVRNENAFTAFHDSAHHGSKIDIQVDNLYLKKSEQAYRIIQTENNVNECPDRPVLLMRTNFEIEDEASSSKISQSSSLSRIVNRITTFLLQFSDYDFSSFSQTEYLV